MNGLECQKETVKEVTDLENVEGRSVYCPGTIRIDFDSLVSNQNSHSILDVL